MSDKKTADLTENDLPAVDTTNPILQPVDTAPALQAVDSDPKLKPLRTLTLDEDPPAPPSATLLLEPVREVRAQPPPTQEIGASPAATSPRKKKSPLKADAFESAPSLPPAKSDESAPRGPASPWKRTAVWTPGLILLTAALVLMVLVTIVVLLRS